jgi:hypothetical protein
MRVILADISTKTIEPKSLNTVKDFKLSEKHQKITITRMASK